MQTVRATLWDLWVGHEEGSGRVWPECHCMPSLISLMTWTGVIKRPVECGAVINTG